MDIVVVAIVRDRSSSAIPVIFDTENEELNCKQKQGGIEAVASLGLAFLMIDFWS